MKNFIQPGRTVTCTAPTGGVVSGAGTKIGDLFGVAAVSADEGQPFEMAIEGVFALPKVAGAISEGVRVYWSAGSAAITTTASGNTLVGHSIGAAADGAATAAVRLSN